MTVPNDANTYLAPVVTVPSALEITGITRSFPMVVTTTMNSNQANIYILNMVVALNVPVTFGMWQADRLKGIILDVTGNLITLAIDSREFDTFINPNDGTIATLSPSGSRNLEYNNNTANHVPFRSLNNIGN